MRRLELLSPAADSSVAKEAILHGADAVYIGATGFGARKNASNSLESIKEVVEFAHRFRAKVYVTVNTIIYDHELLEVEKLCRSLYRIGVDALIVQDMGILRLDLPPIALHASTQCDIRTPEKARFLQEVGFSQLVLARELTVKEINAIVSAVTIPVECFVHGALCVSYSGRCHASCATTSRSANRGECAQLCRLPYTLTDSAGRVLARDKHLLSLRDFNASSHLPELIEAGVSSFKIEGRLKDCGYVKNITSHYNRLLNDFIRNNSEAYRRSSYGTVHTVFEPNPVKSFNRGFTDYFLSSRKPEHLASLLTSKSLGEPISDPKMLNNGDGISYFDKRGNYCGVNVNRVEGTRILTANRTQIPPETEIRRTSDIKWNTMLGKSTSIRKLNLSVHLTPTHVEGKDERGQHVVLPIEASIQVAKIPQDYSREFGKLGQTIYRLEQYSSSLPKDSFIPRSVITDLRRKLVDLLDQANLATYPQDLRLHENPDINYPSKELDFRDNVSNKLAETFYREHGVEKIEKAMEISGVNSNGQVLMTTRHCILRELGMCLKYNQSRLDKLKFPIIIDNGKSSFNLNFDCQLCEMQVCSK